MADDTTQNQQNDAPMPEWLKKAQAVAQTDDNGGSAGSAQVGQTAQTTQVAQVAQTSQTGSAVQTGAQDTSVAPEVKAADDAMVPDWLKKAAEKKVSEPVAQVAPIAVEKESVPETKPEVTPEEVVAATPEVTPEAAVIETKPEVIPELKPEPAPAVSEELPGWLQKIQREEKAGTQPASSAVPAETDGAQPSSAQVADAQLAGAPIAGPGVPGVAETGAAAPAGMLETRPKNGIKTEPAPEIKPVADEKTVAAETEKKAEIAATKEKAKKIDLFKAAESTFLSFMGKGAKAIEKGKTAGQPASPAEAPVTDAATADTSVPVDATVPAGEVTTAPSATPAVLPATAVIPATPGKTPAPAPASKSATDKATAEEKKQLVEAEKIYQQGIATIRDLISPSSMEVRYDMLRVEGMYAQSFYVYAYPRYLDTNWMSPVVNFDVTMDISQFIYPIDSATIMRVLKKKVAQMQASVRINAEKGMVSDPALETALQDAEELRTNIQRGQEKFFQFALYFTIYSEDEKKISKIAKQLESILGGKLILTKKTELQMEHGFNSCLPMCLDELEVSLNMNTSPLSSTFPFSSSDLTSNEGILYGLNRHNDSLIIFDRFSLENANSVVFAKSGAGKSYCVKLEILRAMMVGTDVIVIDPENEYEALAQTVGGAYLRVSLTSDRRINPFDLPAPFEGEEVQPGDLLRQNIISLHGLLKIMMGGISPEEEGIMDKALNDVYNLKGITMELVDPSSIPPPTMEDLYDILSTMEGGQGLAQRLQKYTIGTYSGIFNKPTNVDLESGLMVFCIRDLEDALRPIAMYIILNYIWNRVRSKLKKRILVIDEAWTMMQHDDSARFLFGLVKRARKYYLGITTITQDVEDFVKSPYGKPVVTNSSMQLLLKQAPAAIDVLSKVFNLTEGEKYMLLNSGVGQGLFFAGLKHVAIQIIASYTEDKIVTTNPEEILRGRDTAVSYQ